MKAMKLNLGCGFGRRDGFLNVDKVAVCNPDLIFDAEAPAWPWDTNSVDEVLFNHSLEHMGADANTFLGIMRELYRVCTPGAVVAIHVPHPRHDTFISDPTHVRIITPDLLCLFDLEQNMSWIQGGFANTPLAVYLGVDFRIERVKVIYTSRYEEMIARGDLSKGDLNTMLAERNNVASEYRITLRARKPVAACPGLLEAHRNQRTVNPPRLNGKLGE